MRISVREVAMPLTRRTFFSLAALAPLLVPAEARSQSVPAGAPSDTFPAHEPETVKEMVTVSHGNVARVRELLSGRPALANAGWDWGFGDWETSLGAASHVGNREIAALLLAAGARPTIFSAAMLGQVDVVRAFVTASPGIQRTRGPHGITLLAHARAGKAADVVAFLESIQDANLAYRNEPLDDAARATCIGEYGFGAGATQRLIVSVTPSGALQIRREGSFDRALFHLGGLVFHPLGAEAVRIRFAPGTPSLSVTVEDGTRLTTARRLR
jgi:hypothetical protein